MFESSQIKKLALAIICSIVVFAIGFVFVSGPKQIAQENYQASLSASVVDLNSQTEEQGAKTELSNPPAESFVREAANEDKISESTTVVSETEKLPNPQPTAALFVEGKEYVTSIPDDSSVYELMEKLQKESDFRFGGKNYSGLGFFVEEINGVKNNSKTSQYWIFYVNGEKANQGVSGSKIKQGDIIIWKYEKTNF